MFLLSDCFFRSPVLLMYLKVKERAKNEGSLLKREM